MKGPVTIVTPFAKLTSSRSRSKPPFRAGCIRRLPVLDFFCNGALACPITYFLLPISIVFSAQRTRYLGAIGALMIPSYDGFVNGLQPFTSNTAADSRPAIEACYPWGGKKEWM
jgi:hypothetical protein